MPHFKTRGKYGNIRLYEIAGNVRKNSEYLTYTVCLFGDIPDVENLKSNIRNIMENLKQIDDEKYMIRKVMLNILEYIEKSKNFITIYDLKIEKSRFANMILKLKVKIGEIEKIFRVKNGDRLIIGRGEKADFKVGERLMQISRYHCALIFKDGIIYVEDLGSKNGTSVIDELSGSLKFLKPHHPCRLGEREKLMLSNIPMEVKIVRMDEIDAKDS